MKDDIEKVTEEKEGKEEKEKDKDVISHGKQASKLSSAKQTIKSLGPGIITGAADDDPSGIATFSQAGAQFGFGML
jgi:hypothetical protein